MRTSTLMAMAVLALPALAGCFGGDGFDFKPGEGYKETGKTVHLRMWVEDMVKSEIYPGFRANLWAFCAEPANPNDQYSRDAIEYRQPSGLVVRLQSDGSFVPSESEGKCSVPGPQLRVKQGDRVIVDFSNPHFHAHTIHWHGQFVPWESDGVPGSTQDSVLGNGEGEFRYDFIARRAGTLWYHCHVDTQFHVMQGLYGVIIVEPQDDSWEPKVDKEYTLVFSNLIRDQVEFKPPAVGEVFDPHAKHKHAEQCAASGIPGCKNPALEADPDVFMINGVSAPNTFKRNDTLIVIAPDQTIRIRMLNAGPFTVETIHLHGHDMYVTHKDGNPLPPSSRYYVDTLLIGPGERFDVTVEGREGAEGVWVMHTHITSRVTNDQQYPGGMLTKMVYEGFEDDLQPYDGVELPGGRPARREVILPDQDYMDVVALDLAENVNGPLMDSPYTFPVAMPCAVRQIRFEAAVESLDPATRLLNQVDVDIDDPGGQTIDEGTATPGLPTVDPSLGTVDVYSFLLNETSEPFKVADLMQGDYSVTLSGTALLARATLSVWVDYYETLDLADKASLAYNRPLCGEIPPGTPDPF